MHLLLSVLFLGFVHVTLLVPGYAIIAKSGLFKRQPFIELCSSYVLTLFVFALFATLGYVFDIPKTVVEVLLALYVVIPSGLFLKERLYIRMIPFRFLLTCLAAMSLFSALFIQLTLPGPYRIIPDPTPLPGYSYSQFDVKVLNVSQTNANDNSIPYRQAQFFVNRSNPGKDSFIDEWGVSFFQRTPLMGAVSASYFTLLHENLPIALIWSPDSPDPHHTYEQFQVIASVLNALFILPAFFLFVRFFGVQAAKISLLFIVPSQFFLYNSFFTWPKSLVAFFVLFTWLLLFEKQSRYLVLAGITSGLAYLTHDLALLYLGASLLLLLGMRRFKDTAVFMVINILFMLPWLLASAFVYKKPSTFIYYPISTRGIPQYEKRTQILETFRHTSFLELIRIRLHSLLYLVSPYQLITSEGGQAIGRRLWALGIYSIPGAIGTGTAAGTVAYFLRKRPWELYIMVLVPILACLAVIGWQDGLGALHFAEAVVALLLGAGVTFLSGLRSKGWLYLAYTVSVLQLGFTLFYSYGAAWRHWLSTPKDWMILIYTLSLVIVCGYLIRRTALEPISLVQREKKRS
jgi:hypothetical protein